MVQLIAKQQSIDAARTVAERLGAYPHARKHGDVQVAKGRVNGGDNMPTRDDAAVTLPCE